MFTSRKVMVICLDLALIASSLYIAFQLRFDFMLSSSEMTHLLQGLAVFLTVKPLIFATSGMYRNIWQYASLHDVFRIAKSVLLATSVSGLLLIIFWGQGALPRSVFLLDGMILFILITMSRLLCRMIREIRMLPTDSGACRILIVGAGEAGSILLREIRKQAISPYNVIGLIDDDPEKFGLSLSGVKVLGGTDILPSLLIIHKIEEVIVAVPSGDRALMRRILTICREARVRIKTLPGIDEIVDCKFSVTQVKDVEVMDLLGRKPVELDETSISAYLAGKRILVTGAAGSIGSEVCRQIARYSPAKLILLDNAETPLFHIEKELSATFGNLCIIPKIADVKSRVRVESVFAEYHPEVVFHAAAYKHVVMMEENPAEAALNNIKGTKIVADVAHEYEACNFVLVSTDKAVNPTNIMGATKRCAEIYIQALAAKSKTRFTTVRFGNVLGSNGSVIPIFQEQIRKGGPVTVTHKDVVRYFMTIPEASQLILQAGCLGNSGEIFVLDMGEPVRILSLAEELILLSGLIPYREIDIVFTGLKPGEKLYEEFLLEGEGLKTTSHSMIHVMAPVEHALQLVAQELHMLFAHANAANIPRLLSSLMSLVPEFHPGAHFESVLLKEIVKEKGIRPCQPEKSAYKFKSLNAPKLIGKNYSNYIQQYGQNCGWHKHLIAAQKSI